MSERKSRTKGGGKLSRSEIVSIRLDPRLRFAAELAAGIERRTLSSLVEWAVMRAVKEIKVDIERPSGKEISAAELANKVWDSDEADRLANLAFNSAHLLSFDERVLWKVVLETPQFWTETPANKPIQPFRTDMYLRRDVLRKHWDMVSRVARGEAAPEELKKIKAM